MSLQARIINIEKVIHKDWRIDPTIRNPIRMGISSKHMSAILAFRETHRTVNLTFPLKSWRQAEINLDRSSADSLCIRLKNNLGQLQVWHTIESLPKSPRFPFIHDHQSILKQRTKSNSLPRSILKKHTIPRSIYTESSKKLASTFIFIAWAAAGEASVVVWAAPHLARKDVLRFCRILKLSDYDFAKSPMQ